MMEQNTNNKQLKLKIRSVTCLNDKTLLMRFSMPDETLQNLSYFRKTKKLSIRLWTNGADKGKWLSISSKSLYILDNLKLAISYQ